MQSQNFWAKFHRLFHFSFWRCGICFDYKGEEVVWLFPWEREVWKQRFLSTSFESVFPSLKDIDDMWFCYWRDIAK